MRDWYFPDYPPGHLGTYFTLQAMQALARQDYQSNETRAIVQSVINPTGSENPTKDEAINRLFTFARDGIKYVPDPPEIELVRSLPRSTQSREGDCDDKATWLATALLAIGVPVRFRCQTFGGNVWRDGWDHVYLEFYDFDNWQWVSLDPTADGHDGVPIAAPGWRNALPPGGFEMFFQV